MCTFNGYKPISLCNLTYKVIVKVISIHLKAILSSLISPKQFDFLPSKIILDAIGSTQEALHSIKTKKHYALIPKMDLIKAYDKVDWSFLILLIFQIGLDYKVTNQIMMCITSRGVQPDNGVYHYSKGRPISNRLHTILVI